MKNKFYSRMRLTGGNGLKAGSGGENGPKYKFGLFFLLFLSVVCYISICRIVSYSKHLERINDPQAQRADIEAYIMNEPDVWAEAVRYARNINRFYIYHRDFYNIPNAEKVTEDDMAEDMAVINQNLNEGLAQAAVRYNDIVLDSSKTYPEQRDARDEFYNTVNQLLTNYSYEIESAKDLKLKERISNFFAIENYLDTTREFNYHIKDAVLDETFTNIISGDVESFIKDETYMDIDLSEIHETFNGVPLSDSFARNGIEGVILLPVAQPAGSVIKPGLDRALSDWEEHNGSIENYISRYAWVLIAAIGITALFLWRSFLPAVLSNVSGFMAAFNIYAKIPAFFKLILAGYSAAGIKDAITWPGEIVSQANTAVLSEALNISLMYMMLVIIIFSILYLVLIFRSNIKFTEEFEYRFALKAINDFAVMRKYSKVFMPAVSFTIISSMAILAFFYLWYFYTYGMGIISIAALIICLTLVIILSAILKVLTNYSKLGYYIRSIYEGNPIDVPEEKGFMSAPVNMLNSLSEGLKKTLDEMLISERTKTELITNVSHDLKTPLTSIINYVDLLKARPSNDEITREYVDILKQKSTRLKLLIEDLFEAAKLSNHSMALNTEPADIVELLKQSIGEMSEKFEEAGLNIKYSSNIDRYMMLLDGQRMWRVFENLLNNIVKYSPRNTRVYITLNEIGDNIEITMKNISAFEMDFDANELFERFTRGDSSRSTEGSGLGLSITKDIVELHGGKMNIVIDGDLFKVIILLNKE